jgi:prohibitin 2
VERAKQERQQKIVQAEGEAEAAKMISFAMEKQVIFITNLVSLCFMFSELCVLCEQNISGF